MQLTIRRLEKCYAELAETIESVVNEVTVGLAQRSSQVSNGQRSYG